MPTQSEMGHVAVIPPRVVDGLPRLDAKWLDLFASAPVCDVSDAVGQLYSMAPVIRPLYRPVPRLVGQALTVKCWPGDNLAIYGALGRVQDGDVLVIDNRGHTGSCGSGANVLRQPRARGLRGVVIDGTWRDVGDLQEQGLPMFGRGRSAFSPPKRRPGEINVPVSCGGVIVNPGDLVVGDSEGVVIVPRAYIPQVWAAVAEALEKGPGLGSDEAASGRADYYEQVFTAAGGVRAGWQDSPEE